ncbi:MAG TPA: PilZ domain-containing protein [Vicinamibacterales bacterium]|nr:PilZ domain-containing protein [Vicinamibacterales bacterium]
MSLTVDRRRSPRVPVADHQFLPAIVRDVSLGGLSIELPEPLPQGSIHDFDLRVGDRSRVVLRARVAHTTTELRATGPDVFVTGLEFIEDVTEDAMQKSA